MKFNAGDRVQAQVDVGTGNLLVTVRGMTLLGVNGNIEVGAFYNSVATTSSRLGSDWGLDYTPDVRLTKNSDNSVTYTGPGGWSGIFNPVSGSTTAYTSAAGFKSDLVKTSGGWDLTERSSKTKRTFDSGGGLISVTDRNDNKSLIESSTGVTSIKDLKVTSTAGPTAARVATVKTGTDGYTRIAQPNTVPTRELSFRTASGKMTEYRDPLGRLTTFTYNADQLLSAVAAPGGVRTEFGYNTDKKVTSITQVENAGGPGSSITRLFYQDGNTTVMAAPTTNQAASVSSVPHVTYTLNSSDRVEKAVDEEGRTRSDTYTGNFDTLSSASGTGTSASTTTNVYGANGGDSQTKSTSPSGAAQSLSYSTASPNQYQPSGGTDDAGNASTYTYNGAGNQLSSTDAGTLQAKASYNGDGTVASATSPNNATNATQYTYVNAQPTLVRPVNGGSLANRSYSYDAYGRLRTSNNGRGITNTYNYDANDRLTSSTTSTGVTHSYGYNAAGQMTSRTDPGSTTTWAYDQLGRLTSRANSLFGGTIRYTYNKDSRLATASNPATGGTTSYEYDKSGKPSVINYPYNGAQKRLTFKYDDKGRRTDTWLGANTDNSTWAAHNKVSYNESGRPTRVIAEQGTGNATNTNVVDLSYCYVAGTTSSGGCTASQTNDRSKLVWKKNNVTDDTTTYTYDKSGRLTKANVTGPNAEDYTYTYDKNGNRLSTAGTGQSDRHYTYNAANQITTTGFGYDGAGNMTSHPDEGNITYTADDQMASATPSGGPTYSYTYAGTTNTELIKQTTPEGTYQYAYGRTNQQGLPVVEEVGHDSNTASITNDPITGQPLMLRTSSGMQSLYIYDGAPGSPVALITSEAYVGVAIDYNPFGTQTLTQDSGQDQRPENPFYFAGGVRDRTTGWTHYANRYYNAFTGNFTQQDSLDAPLDPNNANRYAYAGNDPINVTDPTGLNGITCGAAILAIGGGFVGIVGGVLTSEFGVGIAVIVGSGLFTESAILTASQEC